MIKGRMRLGNAASMLSKRGLGSKGKLQRQLDKEVLNKSKPYIPLDTGRTIASGDSSTTLGSGEIRYNTPYVRDIYYNQKGFTGAPQRGSLWFERMKANEKDNLLRDLAKTAGGRAKR